MSKKWKQTNVKQSGCGTGESTLKKINRKREKWFSVDEHDSSKLVSLQTASQKIYLVASL